MILAPFEISRLLDCKVTQRIRPWFARYYTSLKVCTIVYMLEGLLEDVLPEKKTSDLMEQFFVFALTWAFGGPMVVDKSDDYRRCRKTNTMSQL